MKKILIHLSSTLVTCSTLATVVSCSLREELVLTDLKDRSYILDKELQDSAKRATLSIEGVYTDTITNLPPNILNMEGNNYSYAVGGWLELRHFYDGASSNSSNRSNFWHVADDIVLPENTPIYAPSDGEILGAFHIQPDDVDNLSGIGGNILFRGKTKDLTLDPEIRRKRFLDHQADEYMLALMHLSRSTLDLYGGGNTSLPDVVSRRSTSAYSPGVHSYAPGVDALKPFEVKKGDLIGFVGSKNENTGWMPHLHLEVHVNKINGEEPSSSSNRFNRYDKYLISGEYSKDTSLASISNTYYSNIKGIGTFLDSRKVYDREYYAEEMEKRGIIDPNYIFQYKSNSAGHIDLGKHIEYRDNVNIQNQLKELELISNATYDEAKMMSTNYTSSLSNLLNRYKIDEVSGKDKIEAILQNGWEFKTMTIKDITSQGFELNLLYSHQEDTYPFRVKIGVKYHA